MSGSPRHTPRLDGFTARHVLLAAAVVVLLAGASVGRGAPAGESLSLSPSAIQVNPKNPNVVYASTLLSDLHRRSVVKSTDGGKTWSDASTGIESMRGADALALDPRSPNVLYAGTGRGVFKTSDGARTWKLASAGIDFGKVVPENGFLEGAIRAIAIDPLHTRTVYAVGGGVWKSTNGGMTWTKVLGRDIVDLAIDPRRHGTVYATPRRQDAAPRGSIYKTVDGGASWRATKPTGLDVNFSEPLVVDRRGTLYAGAWKGLFASANQGGTWRTLLLLQKGSRGVGGIGAIAPDPSRTNVLYVGTRDGVVKSEDGGQTWSNLPLNIHINSLAIAPINPQTVYAAGDGIWKSRDGGATWHRLT